jgi:AraC-like DNA-binding protein
LSGDAALALRFGRHVDLASFSVVGLLLESCATPLDAIAQLDRYHGLLIEVSTGGARFELERGPEGLWLVDTSIAADDWPELTELSLAWLAALIAPLSGTRTARAAHCRHAAPRHAAEYGNVLGTAVRFRAQRNALLIDEAWLAEPQSRRSRYSFTLFRAHADSLLTNLARRKTVRAAVETMLGPLLAKGTANVTAIAGQLGISRQTLFRRLRAEGVSFEQLLDETRRRRAIDFMLRRGASVGEAAHALGFSEASAFSRAFKRWTGSSPRAFRSAMAPESPDRSCVFASADPRFAPIRSSPSPACLLDRSASG